jgi:hypothetical protein
MTEISHSYTETDVARAPHFIRITHRYGFRSGEWAACTGYTEIRGRVCYAVQFDDGVSDSWPLGDPDAGYEFSETKPE